jgi:hypothetical protein
LTLFTLASGVSPDIQNQALPLSLRFRHFKFLADHRLALRIDVTLGNDHAACIVGNQNHLRASTRIRLHRIEADPVGPCRRPAASAALGFRLARILGWSGSAAPMVEKRKEMNSEGVPFSAVAEYIEILM